MVPAKRVRAVLALLFLVLGCAASTSSVTSHQANVGDIVPWLECVSKSPGLVTAYFGFLNPTLNEKTVPVGADNLFVPNPPNRSQTTKFLPGRSRYFPIFAFSVSFPDTSTLKWQLNGSEVTATSTSNACITSWSRFQMIVDGQTAPTASQVAELTTEGATQMGCDESQLHTSVSSAGLLKWQIVWNVTESTAVGSIAPIVAVTNLFGDNVKFTAFVDKAIALGLIPSATEPMATGQELEGTPINAAPTTVPSAPSTPSTPTPSTPTPSTSQPSAPTPTTPPTAAPTGQASPTSDAPGREEKLIIGLIVALTIIVLLICQI